MMVLPSTVIRKELEGKMNYVLDILGLRYLLEIQFEMFEQQMEMQDWSSAEILGQDM